MKALTSLIFLTMSLVLLSSCQTLPEGWNSTSDTSVIQISNILFETILYDNSLEQKEYKKCIVESGVCGAVSFLKTRGSDVSDRLLTSVKSADNYAKDKYPELYLKHGNLSGIIIEYVMLRNDDKDWISVSVNESDILISLLHLFISNNFIIKPENI